MQVTIKSVIMRSDPKLNAQECCLKVSLLPLRLNIDQDSVLFLYDFFNEISGDYKEEGDYFKIVIYMLLMLYVYKIVYAYLQRMKRHHLEQ